MDINEFVKGINDPRLKDAIGRLGNTPEGQKILNGLSPADKQNLMNKLGGLNANGITADMLLHQINNNPDILNKIGNILNKKR